MLGEAPVESVNNATTTINSKYMLESRLTVVDTTDRLYAVDIPVHSHFQITKTIHNIWTFVIITTISPSTTGDLPIRKPFYARLIRPILVTFYFDKNGKQTQDLIVRSRLINVEYINLTTACLIICLVFSNYSIIEQRLYLPH